jgi:hypothetical protein
MCAIQIFPSCSVVHRHEALECIPPHDDPSLKQPNDELDRLLGCFDITSQAMGGQHLGDEVLHPNSSACID